jgi:hypothetical protein
LKGEIHINKLSIWQIAAIFLIFTIIVFFVFGYVSNDSTEVEPALNQWLGYYKAKEVVEHFSTDILYNVKIYETDNKYYADINISGIGQNVSIKAMVFGNENEIKLLFYELSNGDTTDSYGTFQPDDFLLGFSKQSNLITTWGKIFPMLLHNENPGEYFKKVDKNGEYPKIEVLEYHFSDDTNENLDSWIGTYSFFEHCAPNINMMYELAVLKHNGGYYADLYIDGFQTMRRLRAKVTGNDNEINLTFLKTLPCNILGGYVAGDLLLKLSKSNKLLTNWGKVVPMLPQNYGEGEYFQRCYNAYFNPQVALSPTESESFETNSEETEILETRPTISPYTYLNELNPYFCKKTRILYKMKYLTSSAEMFQNKEIYLNIIKIADLKYGELYKLKLDDIETAQGEVIDITPEHLEGLGYFYVQKNKIYKCDATDENLDILLKYGTLPENTMLICDETGYADLLGQH